MNVTVLSGDLLRDDESGGGTTDNSYHVVTATGTIGAILDGFTVRDGEANGPWPHTTGGGMFSYISSTSLAVANCVFTDNSGGSGGAYYCNAGGAVSFTDCAFEANSADYDGGVISNASNTLTLSGCSFVSNTADDDGGAVQALLGSLFAVECTYTGNQGYFGGAVNIAGSDTGGSLTRCVFTDNSAMMSGGALFVSQADIPVTDCNFAGNQANYGGAIRSDASSSSMINCVVWNNRSALATDTVAASVSLGTGGTAEFRHSLIANSGGSGAWNAARGTDLGRNLDADPRFASGLDPANAPTAAGNLRLLTDFPAIDAGNDAANTESLDLAGRPRIAGTVDLGAYEGAFVAFEHLYHDLDPAGDENGNGRPNFHDYVAGADPTAADDPTVQSTLNLSAGVLYLRVTRRSMAADVVSSYRKSADLVSFQPMTEGTDYRIVASEALGTQRERLTLEILVNPATQPRMLFQQAFE